MCVCCQELAYQPITTKCLHNVCKVGVWISRSSCCFCHVYIHLLLGVITRILLLLVPNNSTKQPQSSLQFCSSAVNTNTCSVPALLLVSVKCVFGVSVYVVVNTLYIWWTWRRYYRGRSLSDMSLSVFSLLIQSCLQRSFRAEVYSCPACRHDLGKDYDMILNKTLQQLLDQFFPGYSKGRWVCSLIGINMSRAEQFLPPQLHSQTEGTHVLFTHTCPQSQTS